MKSVHQQAIQKKILFKVKNKTGFCHNELVSNKKIIKESIYLKDEEDEKKTTHISSSTGTLPNRSF